jgi:imidazolonepropionase-like amidohydrolase
MLAQAFAAEGRLAELDKRTGAAVDSNVDLMRLGAAMGHGGILVDAMVGSGIESLGATGLQKFVNQADAKTCRETAAALEALDAVRPSWQDVLRQEDNWIRRTFGARSVLVEFVYHRQLKQRNGQRAQKSYQAEQLKARRLMMDFASRAFELDKGHRPASAADLVPDYLKAVPQDPVTGTNLVFSP